MVRHNMFTYVDQLKCFLDNADPSYYSPKTKKSAFLYAVDQKNLIFAQVLLNKMPGKNENPREYFQSDLKCFSEQLVFNSPPFKKSLRGLLQQTGLFKSSR